MRKVKFKDLDGREWEAEIEILLDYYRIPIQLPCEEKTELAGGVLLQNLKVIEKVYRRVEVKNANTGERGNEYHETEESIFRFARREVD